MKVLDTLNGKSLMIWKISQCAGGNQQQAVDALVAMGIKRVSIKVAQNKYNYAYNPDNVLIPFIEKCRYAGISVYGWGWVELIEPQAEANRALIRINTLNLDGFEIDAEGKAKNKFAQATVYANALKNAPVPIGLCSYRYPTVHPELPWQEFLSCCDYHAPQVYWNPPWGAGYGPHDETVRSYNELSALVQLPFVPVGRAYNGDGHANPLPQELTTFLSTCHDEIKAPGASFWALDWLYLHSGGVGRAEAIAQYPWIIEPSLEDRVAKLESDVSELKKLAHSH